MDHRTVAAEWSRLLEAFFDTSGGAFEEAVQTCLEAMKGGRKILAFGNGGSAAEAQHFTAELVNRFLRTRPALRAVSLATDAAALTCIANDAAFESVFSRQIEALGDAGDVALALTTSGRSPNILAALKTARRMGLRTIVLTGEGGGPSAALSDILLAVPSDSTPRIQEIHLYLLHALAGEIETRMFG